MKCRSSKYSQKLSSKKNKSFPLFVSFLSFKASEGPLGGGNEHFPFIFLKVVVKQK
jgi:hypothetical protein